MEFKTSAQRAFTLLEIMLVVTIIGLLMVIAMPSFLKSREESVRKACGNNLLQIYNAKLRWALESKKGGTEVPADADLFASNSYIRIKPICPGGGLYTIGPVDDPPTCTVPTHVLP
jgi:prepilin-type N-terminal cleavage/methylation domain-containing protein